MKVTNIPIRLLHDVELIADLNKKQVDAIIQILESEKAGTKPDEFSKIFASKEILSKVDTDTLSFAIFNLLLINTNSNDNNGLVEQIEESLKLLSEDSNEEHSIDYKVLRQNLLRILAVDSNIRTTNKAELLIREFEKIFLESRIITDIRLVYQEDISVQAKHAVLVHQLRITYGSNDEDKNIIIAMDGDDLAILKKDILRAEEKEKMIRDNNFTKDIEFL